MIKLYTAQTPNGMKASVMLEEAEIPYELHALQLSKKQQKEDWFLKINPNGRIPAIVDTEAEGGDFAVFESGAILLYLAEMSGKFLPTDKNKRSQVLQWLMFQMGGIGPMQGQANVFFRYAPEKIPFAIERYQKESRRLYEVLDKQLDGREYIVDEVSIADFATYPWAMFHGWAGIDIDGLDNLQRWMKTMHARPLTFKGLNVPEKLPDLEKMGNDDDKASQQVKKSGRSILT